MVGFNTWEEAARPLSYGLRLIVRRPTTTCPTRVMGSEKLGTTLLASSLEDPQFVSLAVASSYVPPAATIFSVDGIVKMEQHGGGLTHQAVQG